MADADEGRAPLVVTELMVAGMCCQSEVALRDLLVRVRINALIGEGGAEKAYTEPQWQGAMVTQARS